jgi:hypothetical protein
MVDSVASQRLLWPPAAQFCPSHVIVGTKMKVKKSYKNKKNITIKLKKSVFLRKMKMAKKNPHMKCSPNIGFSEISVLITTEVIC